MVVVVVVVVLWCAWILQLASYLRRDLGWRLGWQGAHLRLPHEQSMLGRAFEVGLAKHRAVVLATGRRQRHPDPLPWMEVSFANELHLASDG